MRMVIEVTGVEDENRARFLLNGLISLGRESASHALREGDEFENEDEQDMVSMVVDLSPAVA